MSQHKKTRYQTTRKISQNQHKKDYILMKSHETVN